jgi:hypothetical protein
VEPEASSGLLALRLHRSAIHHLCINICLERYETDFQVEIYAILACAYEIQTNVKSEKCISICSDRQAALKALQAAETTSPLVPQCQRALNYTSTHHSDILEYVEMKLPMRSQGRALLTSLLDQSRPWGSRGRI